MSLEPTLNVWGGIEVFEIWVLKNPFGHHILDLTICVELSTFTVLTTSSLILNNLYFSVAPPGDH